MNRNTDEPDMAPTDDKLLLRKERKPAKIVYLDDDTGVKVQGPYHRARKATDTISSFYIVSHYDPPHLRDAEHRTTEQRKTKAAALHRGREVAANLKAGARADAAPNRSESVSALVEEFLKPDNHRKGMRDGRPVGWDSQRTIDNNSDTMNNLVVPVLGDLRCELLATKVTYQDGPEDDPKDGSEGGDQDGRWEPSEDGSLPADHVLATMERAGLAASTRNTHLSHISGLMTFARDNGWLPPGPDPMKGVTRPMVSSKRTDLPDRWIDPATEVPTRLGIDVLSEVYRTWHQRRRRWSEEYCWRWAQMPLVVAHTGPRFMAFLGWRCWAPRSMTL